MYNSRGSQAPHVILALAVVIVTLAVVYFAVTYEKSVNAVILDRTWYSETLVQYDELVTELETKTKVECYESGNSERCETIVYTEPNTYWETYTRCRSRASGKELPITYPEPACYTWLGDTILYNDMRAIKYRIEDDVDSLIHVATFEQFLWHDLEPGSRVKLKLNILGNVITLEAKNG